MATMQTTDALRRIPRGTPEQAKAWARTRWAVRLDEVDALIDELYRLGWLYRIDSSILVAQSAHETWDWGPVTETGSTYWERYLASAGLGAFDDGTYVGGSFGSGTVAARAQFAHLAAYLGVDLPADLEAADPVYHRVEQAGFWGSVTTLGDLGGGKWATDRSYAAKIADKGRLIFGEFEEAAVSGPTTHSVARPEILTLRDDYALFGLSRWEADEVLANRFPGRNGGAPRKAVLHIQAGNTRGSLKHWVGVDASSHIMAQKDGSLLRVIDDRDGAWTNGDVRYPTAEALGLIQLGGNANNWSLTIEREGGPWDPVVAAQDDAILWQLQDWALRYPAYRQGLVANTLAHYMINTIDKVNCGLYRPRLVARLAEWLELPAPAPEPLEPVSLFPPGMSPELARELYEAAGRFTAPWTSKQIGFDLERSECQVWLIEGRAAMTDPDDYTSGRWPHLVDIVRRGKGNAVHAYVYSDGRVHEKLIRRNEAA